MSKYNFDEQKHIHTLDGKPLHGVTSVLKYWGDPNPLLNWGVKTAVDYIQEHGSDLDDNHLCSYDVLQEARTAHLKKRDKAGDIGTQLHSELEDAMQEWIESGIGVVSKHSAVVDDVVAWMKDNDLVPYKSEAHLYSKELWLGGIVDLIATKGEKKYILDFKTSNTVQTKMFMQMGAYSLMWKEMTGEKIDGVCIIHIPKGKFSTDKSIYWRYDVEELEEAYECILKAYKLDRDVSKLLNY